MDTFPPTTDFYLMIPTIRKQTYSNPYFQRSLICQEFNTKRRQGIQIKIQNATSQKRQLTLLDIFTFYLCASAWHLQKQMKGTADVKRNAEIFLRQPHRHHTDDHM